MFYAKQEHPSMTPNSTTNTNLLITIWSRHHWSQSLYPTRSSEARTDIRSGSPHMCCLRPYILRCFLEKHICVIAPILPYVSSKSHRLTQSDEFAQAADTRPASRARTRKESVAPSHGARLGAVCLGDELQLRCRCSKSRFASPSRQRQPRPHVVCLQASCSCF